MDDEKRRLLRFRNSPTFRSEDFEVHVARGMFSRLLGLAWIRRERAPTGLLITNCWSVHTFGMWFRIDIFFLDENGDVIRSEVAVRPFRLFSCRGAVAVLEFASGEGWDWFG
jgi:uncharacterized protein